MSSLGKVFLVAAFALILAGFGFAIPISSCQQLNTAGATYTVSANIAGGSGACINITAANVILNCQGRSITGTNAAGSIGVYSNQAGTTVRRCTISGFMHGIYFENVAGGTVGGSAANANTVTTTMNQGNAIWVKGGSTNSVRNNAANAAVGSGIFVSSGSSGNTLNANTATSTGWFGILIGAYGDSASTNTLTNNIASGGLNGIGLWNSNGNTLTGNSGTSTGNPGRGIYIISSNGNTLTRNVGRATNPTNYIGIVGIDILWSSNNTLINNTADSQGGAAVTIVGDTTTGPATGNVFRGANLNNGNQFTSPNTLVYISGGSSAGGNTFYWNRFNEPAALYVNDASSGNTWNRPTGAAQGNYWANVITAGPGRVRICDGTNPLNWGNTGPEYPYNAANSHGKFVGANADNAPSAPFAAPC